MIETDAMLAIAASCKCDDNELGQFFVTSFWTLDQTAFSTLHYPSSPGVQLPITTPISDTGATQCVDTSGRAVAVAWPGMNRVTAPASSATIAFVHDFRTSSAMLGDLPADLYSITSAMFLNDHGDCGALMAATASFLRGEMQNGDMLVLDDTTESRNFDGIYGGGTLASHGIPVTGTVHVHGPLSGSFAIWLHWDEAFDDLPRVTSSESSKTGEWYLPQRVDDHEAIFWFRTELVDAEIITIEPR